MPFTCTLAGKCEVDVQGYETQEECLAQCQGAEQRDVLAMILSYDPFNNLALLDLAHSDRVQVLRDLTAQKLLLTPVESLTDLQAIVHGDTISLLRRPQYHNYLLQHYTPLELFYPLLEVFESSDQVPPLFLEVIQAEPEDEEGLADYIESLLRRQNYVMLERFIDESTLTNVISWYPHRDLLDYLLAPTYPRLQNNEDYTWDVLEMFAQAAVNNDNLSFLIELFDKEDELLHDTQIPSMIDYIDAGSTVADWVVITNIIDVSEWADVFQRVFSKSDLIGALARNRARAQELALPVLNELKSEGTEWSAEWYVEAFVG